MVLFLVMILNSLQGIPDIRGGSEYGSVFEKGF